MEPETKRGSPFTALLPQKLRGKEGRVRLILLLGLLGMALILLSTFWGGGKKSTPTGETALTTEGYTLRLEERLYSVVSSIQGVGKVKVMVTLESGVEYVYAQEEKRNTDLSQDYDGELTKKVQERDNSQSSFILVEGASGKKEALVQLAKEPVVKGVVIICQGAGDPVVEQRVTNAVSTALGISSNRICVTKISE